MEPARRGAPEIGVANVIGSVVFSVTGKLGIILLVGGAITVDDDVLSWHMPVLLGMTVLSAVFLATGRLRRWHGVVLLAPLRRLLRREPGGLRRGPGRRLSPARPD